MPAAARQDPTAARICELQGHRKTARRTTHWVIVHPFRRLRRRAAHRVRPPRHSRRRRWRTRARSPKALPEPDHPDPQPGYRRRLTGLRLRAALPHPRPPRGKAAPFADSLQSTDAAGGAAAGGHEQLRIVRIVDRSKITHRNHQCGMRIEDCRLTIYWHLG